jgi:hypothetical protein
MPLKLLVGELKAELHIGLLLIPGMRIGEIKDSSESEEETTNVELKDKLLQVFLKFNDSL